MRRLAYMLLLLVLASCSSIDCPFNHLVLMKLDVDDGSGLMSDTLTIASWRLDGTDTILVNSLVDKASAWIPLSYQGGTDHFVLYRRDTLQNYSLDTLYVNQTAMPHFESVDCAPSFFHSIQSVSSTHHAIDSAIISRTTVDYDTTKTHVTVYFKAGY